MKELKDWTILPGAVLNCDAGALVDDDTPHVVAYTCPTKKAAREFATLLEQLDSKALIEVLATELINDTKSPIDHVALQSVVKGIKLQTQLTCAMHFLEACCEGNPELWENIKAAIAVRG